MFRVRFWIALLFLATPGFLCAQITRTSVPLGTALDIALDKSSLTGSGAPPFHMRIAVSEPTNPDSPYQGIIEEWWVSPDRWRREVTSKDGMRQTIVVADGRKTEFDEGDYFPLWLREFVFAVFDPVPDAATWKSTNSRIEQITMPDGRKSDACARLQSKIGTGDRATDAFWNICFQGNGLLNGVFTPRYGMEFHEYQAFGKKQVARRFVDHPEPGTELIGAVTALEDESKAKDAANLFTPLPSNDDRLDTVPLNTSQMEQISAGNPPIEWPPVRSGNLTGKLAIYISADNHGNVREAWPLNSDNAGLEDPARDQVRHWKLKPAVDAHGHPVQVDGGLGFAFATKIDNPLPVLTGPDIEKVVSGCRYNPVLPSGLLPSGSSFKIRASVNEQGKLTGESYPSGVSWDVIQKTGFSTVNCHFKPWIVDDKPTYYFVDFVFTAP